MSCRPFIYSNPNHASLTALRLRHKLILVALPAESKTVLALSLPAIVMTDNASEYSRQTWATLSPLFCTK